MTTVAIKYLWIETWQNVLKVLICVLLDRSVPLLVMYYSFSVFNIFSMLSRKEKEWNDMKEIKVQSDREGLGNM